MTIKTEPEVSMRYLFAFVCFLFVFVTGCGSSKTADQKTEIKDPQMTSAELDTWFSAKEKRTAEIQEKAQKQALEMIREREVAAEAKAKRDIDAVKQAARDRDEKIKEAVKAEVEKLVKEDDGLNKMREAIKKERADFHKEKLEFEKEKQAFEKEKSAQQVAMDIAKTAIELIKIDLDLAASRRQPSASERAEYVKLHNQLKKTVLAQVK